MTDSTDGQVDSFPRRGLTRYVWLLWDLWLAFMVYPITALFHAHPSPVRVALVLSAAAVFAAIYGWNVWRNLRCITAGQPVPSPWLKIAALLAIALTLTLADRTDWVELFIFTAAFMGPALPMARAARAVGGVVLLLVVIGAVLGIAWGLIAQIALQTGISGVAVLIVIRTVVTERDLRLAREEIARLAVNEERLRFARDLHDLLGHSLSLIALKSELVGRLIPVAPERAVMENRDVETVARRALVDVREAVAGYRQPALQSELENARAVLSAAGIALECENLAGAPPPRTDAVLAWAVREGVTNVVKHSRAKQCTIRLMRNGERTCLEVDDDGQSMPEELVATGRTGSGLTGLAERAAGLGGWCESGPRPEGGFRLMVTLPATGRRDDMEAARPA